MTMFGSTLRQLVIPVNLYSAEKPALRLASRSPETSAFHFIFAELKDFLIGINCHENVAGVKRTCIGRVSNVLLMFLLVALELNGRTDPMAKGGLAFRKILGRSGLKSFRAA